MSFKKTSTPRKPITKAKCQIPLVSINGSVKKYELTDEIKSKFVRYYPIHTNSEVMVYFGLSYSSLVRLRRNLGLEKNMKAVRKIQVSHAKKTCEENGVYDRRRGVPPSEKSIAGIRAKYAAGWHPLQETKKNKKRYERMMQERSRNRKEILAKERMRVDLGLPRKTKLHVPFVIYSMKQRLLRYNMKKLGYILGNKMTEQDRMTIYFNENTKRSAVTERHAIQCHFDILELTPAAK